MNTYIDGCDIYARDDHNPSKVHFFTTKNGEDYTYNQIVKPDCDDLSTLTHEDFFYNTDFGVTENFGYQKYLDRGLDSKPVVKEISRDGITIKFEFNFKSASEVHELVRKERRRAASMVRRKLGRQTRAGFAPSMIVMGETGRLSGFEDTQWFDCDRFKWSNMIDTAFRAAKETEADKFSIDYDSTIRVYQLDGECSDPEPCDDYIEFNLCKCEVRRSN